MSELKDHDEPYDPACPCGTCTAYMEQWWAEEYLRAQQKAEEEAYYAEMQAREESPDDNA